MRIGVIVTSTLAVLALTACAGRSDQGATKNAIACTRDIAKSPEASTVYKRLWLGDGSDAADKLRDPAPLTPEERSALTQLHGKMLQCRQFPYSASSPSDAREMQYRDDFFQRSAAVYYKLEGGDLPVGLANRLFIESNGKFQADMLRDHLRVPPDAVEQQQDAEKMVQENDRAAAAAAEQIPQAQRQSKKRQPKQSHAEQKAIAPTCTWVGNTLNCPTAR